MGAAKNLQLPSGSQLTNLETDKRLVHELDQYLQVEKRLDLLWTIKQTNNFCVGGKEKHGKIEKDQIPFARR